MSELRTSKMIKTVSGWISPSQAAITDAHNHVWIEHVSGAAAGSPTLIDLENIKLELRDYSEEGGSTIVDCQPGGCGRNGEILYRLSNTTGVNIIACTGYHLQQYYPNDYWLFNTSAEKAEAYFLGELRDGITETRYRDRPIKAGFIKIACQATLEGSPIHLMEAAVNACLETEAALEVHTEKGAQGVEIARTLLDFGISPQKLILCHVDKKPDFRFHMELLSAGITLEYDTFFRPKYHPDTNLWPLLEYVIENGFEDQIVVATDLAEDVLWSRLGNGPGLTGLINLIIPRMAEIGIHQTIIQKLAGGNIASRLAQCVK